MDSGIGNVNDSAFKQGSSSSSPGLAYNRESSGVFDELGGETVKLCAEELATDLPSDRGLVGFAKPGGRLDESLQH
jgi:hypothetical protein